MSTYGQVDLLPQPSGFIRVGVSAVVDRSDALKLLNALRKSYETVWLSLE